MKESAQRIHQEVLELILALSDDNSSESGSFVPNSSILIRFTDRVLIDPKCLSQLSTEVSDPTI
jgi:hypothetical protein